ncbi:MAG: hypothetical protein MJ252_12420, partial [archaeon]|nr:hypothetical protein [archaeon]
MSSDNIKQEGEVIPENDFKINEIFKPHHIKMIYESEDPIKQCCLNYESNYRMVTGKADFETTKLMAKAEFAVNVLCFLKEKFPNFEDPVLSKLLNVYCNLIELSDSKYLQMNNDFKMISKVKLEEFKEGLKKSNLIPKMKKEVLMSKEADKKIKDGKFFLNKEELQELLIYINKEYMPYIQMWYYFNNEERSIENEKIDIIINKPIPSLPLNMAKMKEEEKKEEEKKEENEEKKEEEKKEEEKK